MTPVRLGVGLLCDSGGYAPPEGCGYVELVVTLMRRESRGRRAGSDPAMMPMPSSVRDQKPILPVLYTNSPGSPDDAQSQLRVSHAVRLPGNCLL